MVSTITALLTALAALSFPLSAHASCARGLGWATDNSFAPNIGSKPMISWYHHWEQASVPQMPSKDEYVPMFWGPSKWSLWSQRLSEMHQRKPQALMAFNEPDVSSQSNMDPNYAAQLYMEQINPWKNEGVRLGSPAIVWNLSWMATFLNAVQSKGGHVDFICLHWYGSWNDLSGFKSYVQTTHSRFNKNIWITEMGITTASNPTQEQVKSFMMNAFSFLDSQSYVERGAWFGSFESDHPPDGFATGKNALLKPGGALSDMGMWYAYTSRPDKRSLSARQHHRLAARAAQGNDTVVDDDGEPQAVHCDHFCQLRQEQIAEYARELESRGA
jgi:hypothetical protein